MTEEEAVDIIKNGETVKEVLSAWNCAGRDLQFFYKVHARVVDIMVDIANGKDPRFSKEEIDEYINTPKDQRK